jgi:ELWxxDGT repeat protein
MALRRPFSRVTVVAGITSLAVAATLASAGSASAFKPDHHFNSVTTAGSIALLSGYAAGKGNELFRTDGTAAGTKLVKDLVPGPNSSLGETQVYPEFTTIGSTTIFAGHGVTKGIQLWATDGTAAGTRQLTGAGTFRGYVGAAPDQLTVFKGKVYANLVAPSAHPGWGTVLYSTDGTKAGTKLVPGSVGAKGRYGYAGTGPFDLTVAGSKLYYYSSAPSGNGVELWSTNGTSAKRELKASQIPTNGGGIYDLTTLGDKLVIVTDSRLGKKQSLYTYAGSGLPQALSLNTTILDHPVEFDGSLFFTSLPGADPELARVTPDASAGAAGVKPVIVSSDYLAHFTVSGGKLWFDTKRTTDKYWALGSATSTPVLIKDTGLQQLDSDNIYFSQTLNGKLYFLAHGTLFASDGTAAGTSAVADLGLPGGIATSPLIALAGTHLAITLTNKYGKSALWLSDGTAAGTVKVLPKPAA